MMMMMTKKKNEEEDQKMSGSVVENWYGCIECLENIDFLCF